MANNPAMSKEDHEEKIRKLLKQDLKARMISDEDWTLAVKACKESRPLAEMDTVKVFPYYTKACCCFFRKK